MTNGCFIDGRSHDGLRKSLRDEFSAHLLPEPARQPARRSGRRLAPGGRQDLRRWQPRSRGHHPPGQGRHRRRAGQAALPRHRRLPHPRGQAGATGASSPTSAAACRGRRSPRTTRATGSTSATRPSTPSSRSATRASRPNRPCSRRYAHGLSTNRDAWVYNFDSAQRSRTSQATASVYNAQADRFATHAQRHSATKPKDLVDDFIDPDPRKISWSRGLKQRLARRRSSRS